MEHEVEHLKQAIREAWGRDTCYPPLAERWSPDSPALGQCAVTSLVVQDYLGGSLAYCRERHHYWNVGVPLGGTIDLTREQFPPEAVITHDETRTREHVLGTEAAIRERTYQRYKLLSERVRKKLGY